MKLASRSCARERQMREHGGGSMNGCSAAECFVFDTSGSRLWTTLIWLPLRIHVLLELFCEPEKAPDQVVVLSPHFGVVHRFRPFAKHLSQFSAFNVGFHAKANREMSQTLPAMSGSDDEFNVEQFSGIKTVCFFAPHTRRMATHRNTFRHSMDDSSGGVHRYCSTRPSAHS
jgi:hypothetical protein